MEQRETNAGREPGARPVRAEILRGGALVRWEGVQTLDLAATLHCGQAFRWSEGDAAGRFCCTLLGRRVTVWREGDALLAAGTRVGDAADALAEYFDLGRDYAAIRVLLCRDPILREAVAFAPGIRVLRQEAWETLASFLCSSNNHVARISGILARFCAAFGAPAAGGGFCFPTPQRIAALHKSDLAPLRCGYRDEFLLDAARRVSSGALDLEEVRRAPLEQARQLLRQVRGVGPKVAECVLLFGFGRLDAFPVDVHIGRALRLFPAGLPAFAQPYAGVAQQYLFHWMRVGGAAARGESAG